MLTACCVAKRRPALQHAVLRYNKLSCVAACCPALHASMPLQMYTTEIAELFDVLYTKNLSKVRPH